MLAQTMMRFLLLGSLRRVFLAVTAGAKAGDAPHAIRDPCDELCWCALMVSKTPGVFGGQMNFGVWCSGCLRPPRTGTDPMCQRTRVAFCGGFRLRKPFEPEGPWCTFFEFAESTSCRVGGLPALFLSLLWFSWCFLRVLLVVSAR